MYIRGVTAANTAATTVKLAQQELPKATLRGDNMFIGGAGAVGIANTTDEFRCIGNQATMSIVNQANDCLFVLGSGQKTKIGMDLNCDGVPELNAANSFISVGDHNTVFGSEEADVVFSLGDGCEFTLNGGADRAFVNGGGYATIIGGVPAVIQTKVNGGSGDDVISGTVAGLDKATLAKMDIMAMLATINNKAVDIIYKAIGS